MPDAVVLADGTVLVVNGSSAGKADDAVSPVLQAELYDPVTNVWTPLCSMRVPRLYHSTALLLPDGRVLTAGMDEEFNPLPFKYHEYRVEIFSPPYLFRGPRPHIAAAPSAITYATTFDVDTPDGASVAAAALVRPGAGHPLVQHGTALCRDGNRGTAHRARNPRGAPKSQRGASRILPALPVDRHRGAFCGPIRSHSVNVEIK